MNRFNSPYIRVDLRPSLDAEFIGKEFAATIFDFNPHTQTFYNTGMVYRAATAEEAFKKAHLEFLRIELL